MICIYENVTDLSRTRDGHIRYGCVGWGGRGHYQQKSPEGWRCVVERIRLLRVKAGKFSFKGDHQGGRAIVSVLSGCSY